MTVNNLIERRSLIKILYAYNNRNKIDMKEWPELFRIAENCKHVLRFSCSYLAEDLDLQSIIK